MALRLLPLIAPKHVSEFTPGEYHSYVSAMYELPAKRGRSVAAPAAHGLSVRRTARGALSITRRAKQRSFAYVTYSELAALAAHAGVSQAELFNAFKTKDFIIKTTRMECERTFAQTEGKQWDE